MMYQLRGAFQHYAWGGSQYLATLTKHHELCGQPSAELWFGDHPAAPADIHDGNWQPLNNWLDTHTTILTPHRRLPFLLKLLDVAAPLSIQVHPNRDQAQAGFARENAAHIPLTDPKRLYKDDNHKPEMMIALSDFWLLHGFADLATIHAHLHARPSLKPIQEWLSQYGLEQTYAQILRSNTQQVAQWLTPILQSTPPNDPDNPDYWIHESIRLLQIPHTQPDPGLLSFYLFNLLHLRQGEAIIQPAQLPHAYLRGQNIEIMARSDNVLRAGLTNKTIAIDELLRIIHVQCTTPAILPAVSQADWQHYSCPYPDFTISLLQMNIGQQHRLHNDHPGILLTLGDIHIDSATQNLTLHAGHAVLLTANTQITLYSETEHTLVVFASYR